MVVSWLACEYAWNQLPMHPYINTTTKLPEMIKQHTVLLYKKQPKKALTQKHDENVKAKARAQLYVPIGVFLFYSAAAFMWGPALPNVSVAKSLPPRLAARGCRHFCCYIMFDVSLWKSTVVNRWPILQLCHLCDWSSFSLANIFWE